MYLTLPTTTTNPGPLTPGPIPCPSPQNLKPWPGKPSTTSFLGAFAAAGPSVSFDAHQALRREPPGAGPEAAARGKLLADMDDGLRHLYLFTWLERATEPPPEVRVADVWLE